MAGGKTCFVLFVLANFVEFSHCGRFGGIFRGRSKIGSISRGSYHAPSHHAPSPPYAIARPVGFGHLPPAPGKGPVGSSRYYSSSGPEKVKIVNKYNYHYPGYYSLPMAYSRYPGHFYTPSYYRYSAHDTGSTALGFYLSYSLAGLTTPTYSHYSFYDGYRPRYDHYTVHHYYHNRDSVPQSPEIWANTIIGCIGDAAQICPANTSSLCTSNGALMCVANATSTTPCSDNRQNDCVTSTISCINNAAPECKNSNEGTTIISIPCVSRAKVYGELKTVNNALIPANATLVPVLANTININATGTDSTLANNVVAADETFITQSIQLPLTEMTTEPHIRRTERDTAENYCVTILALPAKRTPTQGEEFLSDAKFLRNKFFESLWGL